MSVLTLQTLKNRTANAPKVSTYSTTIEVEKQRVIAEIQAAMYIAQAYPRDIFEVTETALKNCARKSFADKAIYAVPRGRGKIRGPSIRMLEMIAQAYRNLSFGIRELEAGDGYTKCEAFCKDLETNSEYKKSFTVAHVRYTKDDGNKPIDDQTDIGMLVANYGSRHLREAIRRIVPEDLVDMCFAACEKTQKADDKTISLPERIRQMHRSFVALNVTKEMLEQYLGHPLDRCTGEELDELRVISLSIRNGDGKIEDYFQTKAKVEDATLAGLPPAMPTSGNSFMARLAKTPSSTEPIAVAEGPEEY